MREGRVDLGHMGLAKYERDVQRFAELGDQIIFSKIITH